jgi:malonyl CoA-acyl carrier protein transacylase
MTGESESIISFILFVFVVVPLVLHILSQFSDMLRQQQCQAYIQTIQQKDIEISGLKTQLNQANEALEELNQKYQQLIRENITKKDIEEIKILFNNTQSQINLLDQKFNIVNNNFISVYNQIFLFLGMSVILNIIFVFFILGDIISVAVLNVDIKKRIIDWIIKKIKKLVRHEKVS